MKKFILDGDGDYSSSRLAMLFSILVGGIVCLIMAYNGTLDGVIFTAFMTAPTAAYGVGKMQDRLRHDTDVTNGVKDD